MTVRLLKAVLVDGVEQAAGTVLTRSAGIEAEWVSYGIAESLSYEAFSALPIGRAEYALDAAGNIIGMIGSNGRPIMLAGAFDVRAFGAKCDGLAVYDATATDSATSTITSASASFRASDIGKSCAIVPYNDTGMTSRWGTITNVTSATVCTTSLSGTPGAITGATFVYGTDDSAAITAALAAAKVANGTVRFPVGITCTTTSHRQPTGTTVEGSAHYPSGGKAKDFRHRGSCLVLMRNITAQTPSSMWTMGDTSFTNPQGATLRSMVLDCMNLSNRNLDASGLPGGSRTNHVYNCTIIRGQGVVYQSGPTGVAQNNCFIGSNQNHVCELEGDVRFISNIVTGAGNGFFGVRTNSSDDTLIMGNHIWKDATASTMLGGAILISQSLAAVAGSVAVIGNKMDVSYGPHIRVAVTGTSILRGLNIVGNIGFQNDSVPDDTYPYIDIDVAAGASIRGLVIQGNIGRGSWSDPTQAEYTYFIDGAGIAGNVYGAIVGGNFIDNCGGMFLSFTPDHDHGNITMAGVGTTQVKSTTT